ncbi:hypothetical protein ACLB2K_067620 [Fragaria x ananassa]
MRSLHSSRKRNTCKECHYTQDPKGSRIPLYEILNEFQKGHSHTAIVVRRCNTAEQPDGNIADNSVKEVRVDIEGEKPLEEKTLKSKRSLHKWKSISDSGHNSFKSESRNKK